MVTVHRAESWTVQSCKNRETAIERERERGSELQRYGAASLSTQLGTDLHIHGGNYPKSGKEPPKGPERMVLQTLTESRILSALTSILEKLTIHGGKSCFSSGE